MVTEIRLYIEGGGDKEGKARLRQAFGAFLGELNAEARKRRVRWQIVLCGSRNQTFEDFKLALRTHPDALNLLVVDAERPLAGTPRAHLQAGDGWDLTSTDEDQCHLMVEVMENWFLADAQALATLYGKEFASASLPKTRNLETISKSTVLDILKKATRATQKGEYHKMRHSPLILEQLDPQKVRQRAPHCDRLWSNILEQLGAAE